MCTCFVRLDVGGDSTTAVSCTCQLGFVGDGYMCNANTWLTLSELSAAKQFYRVIPTFVN